MKEITIHKLPKMAFPRRYAVLITEKVNGHSLIMGGASKDYFFKKMAERKAKELAMENNLTIQTSAHIHS